MADQFYTYMHTRNDTGQPFYIGKGKGDRAYQRKTRRSIHWRRVASKYGYQTHILASWETEKDAHSHEVFLISCMRDSGAPLVNQTNGGDGTSGFRWSEESKKRFSSALTGIKKSEAHKAALRKPKTKTEKLIAAQKAKIGKKPTAEIHARFISAINARRVVCLETGIDFETAVDATRWLHTNGKSKAQPGPIHRCCKGTAHVAYGHTWSYKKDINNG